jgi:hypothetical protein
VGAGDGRDDGQPEPVTAAGAGPLAGQLLDWPLASVSSASMRRSCCSPSASSCWQASGPTLEPAPPDIPNAWFTAISIVNKDGGTLTASELAGTCPGIGGHRQGGAFVRRIG